MPCHFHLTTPILNLDVDLALGSSSCRDVRVTMMAKDKVRLSPRLRIFCFEKLLAIDIFRVMDTATVDSCDFARILSQGTAAWEAFDLIWDDRSLDESLDRTLRLFIQFEERTGPEDMDGELRPSEY